MICFTYIWPFFQPIHLTFKKQNYFCLRLLPVWDFEFVSHTRSDLCHILKCRMFEGLNWLSCTQQISSSNKMKNLFTWSV